MGSQTLLFIGDDWREQFRRYQSMEYAFSLSPYIVDTDYLAKAKAAYAHATAVTYRLQDGREVAWFDELDDAELRAGVKYRSIHKPLAGAVPFDRWAMKQYGIQPLAPGQAPDLLKAHRWGWLRRDETGEVIELVTRDIPDSLGYFSFVRCRRPAAQARRRRLGHR